MQLTVLPPDYDVYLSPEADLAFETDILVDPGTTIGRVIVDAYRAFPEEFQKRSDGPDAEHDPGAWFTCLWSTSGMVWSVQDAYGPFLDGMDVLDAAGTLWFNQPVRLVKHAEWVDAHAMGLTTYDPTKIATISRFGTGADGEILEGVLEYWPAFLVWLEDIGKNLASDAIVALGTIVALKYRDWRARRARPRDVRRVIEIAKAHRWTKQELATRLSITCEETQYLLAGFGYADDPNSGVVIRQHTSATLELETTLEQVEYEDFSKVLSPDALQRALVEDPRLAYLLRRQTGFPTGGDENAK